MRLGRIIPAATSGGVDFAAVGEISLDTFARGVSRRDAPKQSVQQVVDLPGGQAATAAVACRRLGWRSLWIGAVGDDAAARQLMAALQRERVDAHAITRHNVMTRRAVILVDATTGDRTVFQHRSDALNIRPGELPDEIYASARILLVDATDPAHAIHAARVARAAGVATMLDVDYVGPELDALLRAVEIVVMPGEIAEAAAGVSGVGAALVELGNRSGALAVVATLGSEGALGWARGEEIRAQATAVDAVDTTGAGDAFRAGFAAAWLGRAGTDPYLADLLADSNLVAGLACRALGAQTALPTALEVPAHLRGPV